MVVNNISFFIPAYNCEKTIAESIESILITNFAKGDELIIVNDCSSDNTLFVLEQLKTKHSLLKIITHKRNKGGAAARNTAVENANNSLLFCLDSDNILAENSINPLKEYLLKEEAEIASFQTLKYFSKSTQEIDEIWNFQVGEFTIEDLLNGKLGPGASGNYLFTKKSWEKAKGYAEDLGALDTWAFGFKQLIERCKMVVLKNSFYFHRRGHESYYIRDAWAKRKSVSLRLIKLIIDYVDIIHPKDVEYIFSKKGRFFWYENLNKKSIRVIEKNTKNNIWQNHSIENKSLKQKIVASLKKYK